jgi:hypothetical protein
MCASVVCFDAGNDKAERFACSFGRKSWEALTHQKAIERIQDTARINMMSLLIVIILTTR